MGVDVDQRLIAKMMDGGNHDRGFHHYRSTIFGTCTAEPTVSVGCSFRSQFNNLFGSSKI